MKKLLLLASFLNLVFLGFSQTISVSSLKKSSYCQGDTAWFVYTTSGTFDTGNRFKVEIGPSSGMFFGSPEYLGEKVSSFIGVDSIPIVIPASLPNNLTELAYRVVSTSPVVLGNTIQSIGMYPNPAFKFASTDTVFCVTEKALQLNLSISGLTAVFTGKGVSNNLFLPSVAGIGYHYLNCTVTSVKGCSTIDSLKIKINSTAKPGLLSNEYITPYFSQIVYAFGDSITWYNDSILTSLLYKGGDFDYNLPNNDTGAHYLYATQKQNGCESEASKVSVIYRPKIIVTVCLAKVPLLENKSLTLCEGDTSKISVKAHYTNFNNIEWMDGADANIANLIAKDSIFNFQKQNYPGTWMYYAFEHDTLNNCYSHGAAVNFVVNAKTPISMDLKDTVCFFSKQPIQITTNPSGGNLTGTGIQFSNSTFIPQETSTPNIVVSIKYSYSNSKGCVTDLVKNVFLNAPQTLSFGDAIGYLDTIPELYIYDANDTTSQYYWYQSYNSTSFFKVGQTYTPKVTNLGIYTYYVSQVWRGCESERAEIKLTVKSGSGKDGVLINTIESLKVYPIPTGEMLYFEKSNDLIAEVYTLQGVKVLSKSIVDGCISLKDISAGMYIVKVLSENTILETKIIKE